MLDWVFPLLCLQFNSSDREKISKMTSYSVMLYSTHCTLHGGKIDNDSNERRPSKREREKIEFRDISCDYLMNHWIWLRIVSCDLKWLNLWLRDTGPRWIKLRTNFRFLPNILCCHQMGNARKIRPSELKCSTNRHNTRATHTHTRQRYTKRLFLPQQNQWFGWCFLFFLHKCQSQ